MAALTIGSMVVLVEGFFCDRVVCVVCLYMHSVFAGLSGIMAGYSGRIRENEHKQFSSALGLHAMDGDCHSLFREVHFMHQI